MKRNSAEAIIVWKDKILLFHRDNISTIPDPDCWDLPGGGMEEGETFEETVKRELQEEVSYVPRNLEYLTKIKRDVNLFTYVYWAYVDDNEAKLFKHGAGEGQEIKFFTLEEIMNLKLTAGLNNYFNRFKKEIEEAIKSKTLPKISL